MSNAAPLIFPLTEGEFAQRKVALDELGVHIGDARSGQLTSHGVTMSYLYDGKQLSIVIVHKPMLFPQAIIEEKIREWFTVPCTLQGQ